MTPNDFQEVLFVLILDISWIVTLGKQTYEMIKYVVPSSSNASVCSGDQCIAGPGQMWSVLYKINCLDRHTAVD